MIMKLLKQRHLIITRTSLVRSFHPSNVPKNKGTIFALSSGQGKCGVAVIRVSGPASGNALKCLTNSKNLPQPRTAFLKTILDPSRNEVLDRGLILWFPGPKSFTGEDSCEFQVHGGVAVVNSILNALASIGLKPAQAGEFTRRAFLNGKLDLTKVEGLSDLLSAETELQRKQAFLQSEGFLSQIYNSWRDNLIKNLAHIEAHIDFDETDELHEQTLENVYKNVEKLDAEISEHVQNGSKGERLRNGVKVVILGETNAGKSSFFNILCNKPASIVTHIEGTTRDVLEINCDINGYPIVLADTAGLRPRTTDVIEQEGIRRAKFELKQADLVLFLIDINKFLHNNHGSIDEYIIETEEKMDIQIANKEKLIILNKSDLISDEKILKNTQTNEKFILMSCKNKSGISNVMEDITNKLRSLCANPTKEHPIMNQIRHRKHLLDCLKCLRKFEKNKASSDVVILAEDLRNASYHLGHLTGQVTNENILDVIFKEFCIGK